MKYKIKELKRTCMGCPSQWVGKLNNGRMIYIRYRWGCLEVNISKNPTNDVSDAVEGKLIFKKYTGGEYDGIMKDSKMFSLLKDIIER